MSDRYISRWEAYTLILRTLEEFYIIFNDLNNRSIGNNISEAIRVRELFSAFNEIIENCNSDGDVLEDIKSNLENDLLNANDDEINLLLTNCFHFANICNLIIREELTYYIYGYTPEMQTSANTTLRLQQRDRVPVQVRPNTPIENNVVSSSSIGGKLSAKEAFGTNDGPCLFRALLAIAETRVGENLSQEQFNQAIRMYYGNKPTSRAAWSVDIQRYDNKNRTGAPLIDAINIGFELLNRRVRASWIDPSWKRNSNNQTFRSNNIPPGTQATIIGVPYDGAFHFLEGNAQGIRIFDPSNKLDHYIKEPIVRVYFFRFYEY